MKFDIIGLTNRDKRVYEALLTMPNCSIRALAEQTGINRGSVYESIKSLSKAGLVHQVTTGKQMRYRAEDPAVLKEILQEKRQILDKSTKKLDLYVASLRQPKPESTDHPLAALYEGDEGLASILRDVLKTCRLAGVDHYRAISSPRVSRYLYNIFRTSIASGSSAAWAFECCAKLGRFTRQPTWRLAAICRSRGWTMVVIC